LAAGDLSFFDDTGVDTSFDDSLSGMESLGGGGGAIDTIGTDTGSSIWNDISGFLGGAGTLGPAIGGGILSGVKSLLGSGGATSAAAGAATTKSPAVKAAVKRALRASGVGHAYRRMNPGNFRALHRAMRRLSSFEKAARRVYQFTHPAKHKSHFKFRRRKRR
jgi:hypothetical protein